MNRERVRQTVLVIVGLFFLAAVYPASGIVWHKDQPSYETAMGLIVYFALGVFLLRAVARPAAHRSLIAFAAWSSFAHAALMWVMVLHDSTARDEWVGALIFSVIGATLLFVLPKKDTAPAGLSAKA